MNHVFIKGNKVDLKPYEPADAEIMYHGHNDPDVREAMFFYYPVSRDEAENRIAVMAEKEKAISFMIVDKSDGKTIGQTALVRPDWVSRAVTFYILLLDKSFWGRGLGREATELVLRYAFEELNLNRVQLHVNTENARARKVYEDMDFKVEGTLRQAMYKKNQYYDFFVMSILRDEYFC